VTPRSVLVGRVSARTGLGTHSTARVLNALADLVLEGVREEGRAAWPGFGVFLRTTRKARRILNPATGRPMRVGKAVRVLFRVAKSRRGHL
jgi:nucleoid DNA-binding protein